MADIYESIAPFYDAFNDTVDYVKWADFIEKTVKENYNGKIEYILDLGCGTGSMTLELAGRGYDMIGVDLSPDMLCVAQRRAEEEKKNVLWLMQDMRSFELYGTVEAAVCTLDGINHLTGIGDVKKCFSLVHNYLVPDGIFVFDINAPYKFETVYAQNTYTYDSDGAFLVWENDYNENTKTCDFYLTLFEEQRDGSYVRSDSRTREKAYSRRQIEKALFECGMELIGVYADFDGGAPREDSTRLHFVSRAKK